MKMNYVGDWVALHMNQRTNYTMQVLDPSHHEVKSLKIRYYQSIQYQILYYDTYIRNTIRNKATLKHRKEQKSKSLARDIRLHNKVKLSWLELARVKELVVCYTCLLQLTRPNKLIT